MVLFAFIVPTTVYFQKVNKTFILFSLVKTRQSKPFKQTIGYVSAGDSAFGTSAVMVETWGALRAWQLYTPL